MNSQEVVLIIGDFSAKVGDEKDDDIVGPLGIGKLYDRGNKLIEWCQNNEFTITNTWCQNHTRRQWTRKSPDGKTKNKIDYILIQKRFHIAIKTVKSLPGAYCDSDHFAVMCKFQIKLKNIEKSKKTQIFQMDLLTSDKELGDKIAVNIQNKYEALNNISE